MKKDIIKALASQAKERMKNGGYSEQKYTQKSVFVTARQSLRLIYGGLSADYKLARISPHEDEALYKKVCDLLSENDERTNPIGMLVDKRKYSELDRVSRERYIFELSDKYKKFKNRYEQETTKSVHEI